MALSGVGIGIIGVKRLTIPDQAPAFAITGRSPRFGDTPCVHELIVHTP